MSLQSDYIFYKDRIEWKDVTPIMHDNNERTAVRINYSEKFSDVYNYIRAAMVSDERSERTLKLTEDALVLNPANYSVWYYRRNILSSLESDLYDELKFVSECIDENQKNYQVWYHRQWVIKKLTEKLYDTNSDTQNQLLVDELTFTESYLYDDSKNYHVWQYRHWVVHTFNLFDDELRFAEKMLNDDVYNNSAWNHRYYVIKALSGFTDLVIDQETDYVMKYIKMAPENESSWNYLNGIYLEKKLFSQPKLEAFCLELLKNEEAVKSPFLHSFHLDLIMDKLENVDSHAEGDLIKQKLLNEAKSSCEILAEKVDRIRINYWKYRLKEIQSMFQQ